MRRKHKVPQTEAYSRPCFDAGNRRATRGNILLRVDQPARALSEYEEYLHLAPRREFAAQVRTLVEKIKEKNTQKK